RRRARDLAAPGYTATIDVARDTTVVVVATLDQATAVTHRLAAAGLELLRAESAGRSAALPDTTRPLPPGTAAQLRGRYGSGAGSVLLEEYGGRLYLSRSAGGIRAEIRQAADGELVTDDVAGAGIRLRALPGGRLVVGEATLARRPDRPPAAPGQDVAALIAEYGPQDAPLYLLEDDGRLVALVQRVQAYPLRRAGRAGYVLTGPGSFAGTDLAVLPADGSARAVVLGRDTLVRRLPPPGAGEVSFRIQPVRPIAELRQEAPSARPPVERGGLRAPDLVELRSLDGSIRYDIRYATPNNFMGTPMYTSAHAFLQRPAAEALARVSAALRPLGYGLLVHDAYRPWYVTWLFWEATPPAQHDFVADPAHGSRHNRGCAVDLELYDLATGKPLPETGGYDEFSERSFARYPGGSARQRWDRDLLRRAMEAQGFTVLDAEWWHFDYKDWAQYPILNVSFEELAQERR
ncbi:MAG TPA: M15 family metallopeptidase, partial [Longimicrobiales bacterium]